MSDEDHPHRRVVASLFGTIKLVQMYGPSHDATGEALWTLLESMGEVADADGNTTLTFRGARIKVNGRAVRAAEGANLALAYLSEEFNRRRIAALHIRTDAGPGQLASFVELFLGIATDEVNPAETLMHRMQEGELTGIAIEPSSEEPADPVVLEEQRTVAMGTYVNGLRAFRDVLRADGYPDRVKVRRAKRAIHGLVDRFLEDEAAVLMLAQLRGHDVKLFHHSMNVSIYAMAIGQRIGMGRRQLGQLGLAALFHDLGKTIDPPALAELPSGERRLQVIHEGRLRGARMLLAESAGQIGMLKAAIASYEQQSHFDGSGTPTLEHEQHLVARIIAIADSYDTLTTPAADAVSPYQAFRLMQARSGTVFDPVLLKVFVNALGIYPVGSVVELSTGEVALVTAGPRDPTDLDRPIVRILEPADDGALERGEEVDLGARDTDGAPVRDVRGVRALRARFSEVGDIVAAS